VCSENYSFACMDGFPKIIQTEKCLNIVVENLELGGKFIALSVWPN